MIGSAEAYCAATSQQVWGDVLAMLCTAVRYLRGRLSRLVIRNVGRGDRGLLGRRVPPVLPRQVTVRPGEIAAELGAARAGSILAVSMRRGSNARDAATFVQTSEDERSEESSSRSHQQEAASQRSA